MFDPLGEVILLAADEVRELIIGEFIEKIIEFLDVPDPLPVVQQELLVERRIGGFAHILGQARPLFKCTCLAAPQSLLSGFVPTGSGDIMPYETVTIERFFEQLRKVTNEFERNHIRISKEIAKSHPGVKAPGSHLQRLSDSLRQLATEAEGYFADVPVNIEFGTGTVGDHVKIK